MRPTSVYAPASLDNAFRVTPVLTFRATICALGMGAPLAPVMVPLIVPLVVCANTLVAARLTSAMRKPIAQAKCLKPYFSVIFIYISVVVPLTDLLRSNCSHHFVEG